MEEIVNYSWQQQDPFEALIEGKVAFGSSIISRTYSASIRYNIQLITGSLIVIFLFSSIYFYIFTKSNIWLIIAGSSFIIFSTISGFLVQFFSNYKVIGTIIFHDRYAVISDLNGVESSRFLYDDLRQIIHDDDSTVQRARNSKNKYLDHVPLRFILQGKNRKRLELSTNLENYYYDKVKLNYQPTLEEVFLFLYPSYETYDKKRKISKNRFLSN